MIYFHVLKVNNGTRLLLDHVKIIYLSTLRFEKLPTRKIYFYTIDWLLHDVSSLSLHRIFVVFYWHYPRWLVRFTIESWVKNIGWPTLSWIKQKKPPYVKVENHGSVKSVGIKKSYFEKKKTMSRRANRQDYNGAGVSRIRVKVELAEIFSRDVSMGRS